MPDEVDPIRYNPPQVMTLEEVAVYLGFAEATIRRMLRDREIPAAKVAGQWRFLKPEVDRWLEGLSKQQTASRPHLDRKTCEFLSKHILENFPGDKTAENIAKIILLTLVMSEAESEGVDWATYVLDGKAD